MIYFDELELTVTSDLGQPNIVRATEDKWDEFPDLINEACEVLPGQTPDTIRIYVWNVPDEFYVPREWVTERYRPATEDEISTELVDAIGDGHNLWASELMIELLERFTGEKYRAVA